MADTIEALKDKLQALEADSGGNKDRKKLEVALEPPTTLGEVDPLVAVARGTGRDGLTIAGLTASQGQLVVMDGGASQGTNADFQGGGQRTKAAKKATGGVATGETCLDLIRGAGL